MEETNNIHIENVESIKLSKMSKGYNWEIKIYPIPCNELSDIDGRPTGKKEQRLCETDIDRLQRFDDELRRRFDNQLMKGGNEQ
jgi:hypothetical protein